MPLGQVHYVHMLFEEGHQAGIFEVGLKEISLRNADRPLFDGIPDLRWKPQQ